jgi:putative effector of murein hydrolase
MEDAKAWIVKIIVPALVAISIKLAIQSKSMRMSWFNIMTSFITGIGAAYLCSDIVLTYIAPEYTTAAIALIAMSGEKIGYWVVYKFNVESILEGLLDKVRTKK